MQLDKLNYSAAEGVYRGVKEASFVVLLEHYDRDWDTARKLANRYAQDTVLRVDANGLATMFYMGSGERLLLGFYDKIEDTTELPKSYTRMADGSVYAAKRVVM